MFEREGGVGHLILCSKKTEMLSSNVSRLSCADEKKKCFEASAAARAAHFGGF